eukprot:CAMPEP_0175149844 /NCGR_PEP_ID=MMETSP0087-20121206/17495_1 /TAXON_ID=136419 /ORGANISM="Unknown Unknown, Strain D1" /LENGTH=200 /DNA_ID=CAMNT_0016435633 /DNA_START=71 /DNA_END=673 /DNA_ORIENTATION=+
MSNLVSVEVNKREVNAGIWFAFNFLWAVVWGMFLHFIPAEFIGITISLGSSDMHQKLGIVWMVLAIVAGILCCQLRQQTLVLKFSQQMQNGERNDCGRVCCACCAVDLHPDSIMLVCMDNQDTALLVRDAFRKEMAGEEANHGSWANHHSKRTPWAVIVGTVFTMGLFINAIVVAALIQKCNNCGGCNDKGLPDQACWNS